MADSVLRESLRIFVYGTLKSDQSRHGLIRASVIQIRPAKVFGRLYHMFAGYPMLIIPEDQILATGSINPDADLTPQNECRPASALDRGTPASAVDNWQSIRGELIWLNDNPAQLTRLDRYEGFSPGRESLFRRVLTTVHVEEPVVAWTYVAPSEHVPLDAIPAGTCWPV